MGSPIPSSRALTDSQNTSPVQSFMLSHSPSSFFSPSSPITIIFDGLYDTGSYHGCTFLAFLKIQILLMLHMHLVKDSQVE